MLKKLFRVDRGGIKKKPKSVKKSKEVKTIYNSLIEAALLLYQYNVISGKQFGELEDKIYDKYFGIE